MTNLTWLNDDDPDNDINAVRTSDEAISIRNEQLLLDWGLAITWEQYTYGNSGKFTEPLESSIEFADPEMPWFFGIPDGEGLGNELNWIAPVRRRPPTRPRRKRPSSTTSSPVTPSTSPSSGKASSSEPGPRTRSCPGPPM